MTTPRRKGAKRVRPEKEAHLAELRQTVAGSSYLLLADYTGLNSSNTAALRGRLRGVGARMRVAPNRLLRDAVADAGAGFRDMLRGSTAVVTGEGDVVEVSKALAQFNRETKMPVLKGGLLEGRLLTAADVVELANLPAKPVLQAMFLGVLVAPMRNLAGVLHQKLASLMYVLKAIEDKKQAADAPVA